jgi:hypothetical protein
MKPLFEQIAAMQDIILADEPMPARRYPEWRVVKPKPRDPFACRYCIDGEREDGGLCPWCGGSDES